MKTMRRNTVDRKAQRMGGRDGFTLVELLAVIAVLGLLAALGFPALARARDSGKRAGCTSNLRQVHLAAQMYADDNDGFLPPKFEMKKRQLSGDDAAKGKQLNTVSNGIQTVLGRFGGPEVFRCPADFGDSRSRVPVWRRVGSSYEVNGRETDKPEKSKLNELTTQDVAKDLFKPWDSDDPRKVAEKVAKGELGPVKWHRRSWQKVMGDGHVVTIGSKEEDKDSKGD